MTGELTEERVREIAREELAAEIRRLVGEFASPVESFNPALVGGDVAAVGENPVLLTVSEVVALLKVSRPTVYRLFTAGELAWVQVGAHRRVTQTEIDRFITDHSCSAVA